MIKICFIFVLLFSSMACTKTAKNPDFSDDYVLIEFAAKLEEDHYRIYPEPLENYGQKPTE